MIYENKLFLKIPDNNSKRVIMKGFANIISQEIEEVFGFDEFEILNPTEFDEFNSRVSVITESTQRKTKASLNPKYTFENFVVGPCNQFAHSACLAVAKGSGVKFNPLFIYGGVGLGKTHLLHAIGNYMLEQNPDINISYKTCENFTNDYINCLKNNKDISEFRSLYRNVDVLMIDDIQSIAGKMSTQEEFFNTFNDLYQANKQIVIASDRPPSEIKTLSDRLISRFLMGLTVDIQSPDYETRFCILQKKAQLENQMIDTKTLEFIAENISTNIRELEGALNKTIHYAILNNKKVATLEDATQALQIRKDEISNYISPITIINNVCKYYRIDEKDLLGEKRNKEIVNPRHVCIYLMCEMLNIPLDTIGKEIFHRDHTSIMHARDKISKNIITNDKLKREITDLKSLIQNK